MVGFDAQNQSISSHFRLLRCEDRLRCFVWSWLRPYWFDLSCLRCCYRERIFLAPIAILRTSKVLLCFLIIGWTCTIIWWLPFIKTGVRALVCRTPQSLSCSRSSGVQVWGCTRSNWTCLLSFNTVWDCWISLSQFYPQFMMPSTYFDCHWLHFFSYLSSPVSTSNLWW